MSDLRSIPTLQPASHPGTLALIGSGEYLPAMRPVDEVLLGLVDGTPQVVCLPTAAGTEGWERINYWSNLGVQHFTGLGVQASTVPVIDRTSAENEFFAGQIRQANFVYLSGGKPDYLFKTLQGSLVWAAIQSVLQAGGVLAGCSAGAMILGERLTGFPLPGLGNTAFGLLPQTIIVPHFDEIPGPFVRVVKGLSGHLTLVGIEGNTALLSVSGEYRVTGSGRVTVWGAEGKTVY